MPVFDVDVIRSALEERRGQLVAERLVQAGGLEVGVVQFRPEQREDSRQIVHADRAVVALCLAGAGRLRLGGDVTPVQPGTLVHLPPNTPHDFTATGESLTLLYALVEA